jgi:hypothetical protein
MGNPKWEKWRNARGGKERMDDPNWERRKGKDG